MAYKEINLGNPLAALIQGTDIGEVLSDPEIIDPTRTLYLVGPGHALYDLNDRRVDGPQDGLVFLVGYLANSLVFIERPPNVTSGGLRATEEVFETMKLLVGTGYSDFQVVYFDMNRADIGKLRKTTEGPITVIDNSSYRFWGPSVWAADSHGQAEYVLGQYDKFLISGDRLLLSFAIADQSSAACYAEVCDKFGFPWKAIRTEAFFPKPEQLDMIGLTGESVLYDEVVYSGVDLLLVIDKK